MSGLFNVVSTVPVPTLDQKLQFMRGKKYIYTSYFNNGEIHSRTHFSNQKLVERKREQGKSKNISKNLLRLVHVLPQG